MGITYSSIVEAPQTEVFAWHTRPGAMTRLTPPWLPVRVVAESDSLKDGRAVLALPGGLKWIAQHDAAAYDPPQRFVDQIVSDGFRSRIFATMLPWRHVHSFVSIDDASTRMIDEVATRVPERWLRPMFAYRHRQLADDLAAHRRAADRGIRPMTVAITGSSGLVGTALSAFLSTGGHRVVRLVRRDPANSDERFWDPENPDRELLSGVDALVHLAGASIAGRFTSAHKRAIRGSRVPPTRSLAELVAHTDGGPRTFVIASAVGYYGSDRGEEFLTEDSSPGAGFLAEVVADWENSAAVAKEEGVRVVQVRTGVVQSSLGGTLKLFRPLFTVGLGGRIGNGEQWLSWIGLDDLVDVYYRVLFDAEIEGAVNAVAPNPVRNIEYTRTFAHILHRPAMLPVPRFGPRLILGEQGARELAEASQRVVPSRLESAGHQFRHPTLDQVLRHQLGQTKS